MRDLLAVHLMLGALVGGGATAQGRGVELYVATDGDDDGSGRVTEPTVAREGGPFATLERARDEIRRLRRGGELEGGATVYVREGVYPLTECFALDERDSGAEEGRIVYRAYRRESVRLTGGKRLRPGAFRPVTDAAIVARLPEAARGEVRQIDLRAEGVEDLGEMKSRGFAHPYVNASLEVFQNDEALTLARWPNDDVVPTGEVIDRGSVPRDADYSNRGAIFRYGYDRADRWTEADDIWLSGLFCYGFADDTIPVESIDTEQRTIKLARPHIYGIASGTAWRAYYALNLLEEIDQPGEWYLDRDRGILYVWPPAPMDDAPLWVSVLDEPLVALEGASYVTLQGLTLEMTRGMGVYIERGTANLIAGCIVRNTGNVGICFGQGAKADGPQMQWGIAAERAEPLPPVELVSRDLGGFQDYIYADTTWNRQAGTNHGVVSCDIYNTGAGGVVLSGGDRKTLTPGGNYVLNCHIHHYSRLDRAYRAAVYVDGVGNRIAHNLMHDAPHNAILLHGNDHLIEYNDIFRVCQNADDMGAFYMGRDPSEQGIVLRHNFFHHNGSGHAASCATYFDDGACGALVEGNVIYRQIGQPIWINGGHDHTFTNSIFVDCGGVSLSPGMDNAAWMNYLKDPLQVRRLRESLDITQPPYSERYPGLADAFSEDPNYPRGQTITRNVSVRSGGFGGGRNTVGGNFVTNEDPGFVDAAQMDFTLKPDSVVFDQVPGFEAIPFGEIGLYRDEYRRELPPREVPELATRRPRDPEARAFAADFAALKASALPGQADWERFGSGPDLRVAAGTALGAYEPGLVAVAMGADSWSCIGHGLILDGARETVLEADVLLPAPLTSGSFLEVYLNRGAVWSSGFFGISLQGGQEEGVPDGICVRKDGGLRVLADDHLPPDRWYRLRLTVPAGSETGTVTLLDLSAGETTPQPVTFEGSTELDFTASETWNPPLADLDTLVLRLGGTVQVAAIRLSNGE